MALLVAVVAVALAIPLSIVVSQDQRAAFVSDLEIETLATASVLASAPQFDWQKITEQAAQQSGARVVVVDPELQLIADSDSSGVDRSFDRPEIDQALVGLLASDARYSQTLMQDLRYVAAPIVQNFQTVGAVRLSLSEASVDQIVRETQLWLAVFVLAVIVGASLIGVLAARSATGPLNRLADVAARLPDDLSLRAASDSGPTEVRSVASALNVTAARLAGILSRTQRVGADASHHLRTPLTAMRLRLEAIEETSDQSEVVGEAQAAIAEIDRLTRRIDQILALAKSDAADADQIPVNVMEVVVERVAELRSAGEARGIEVLVDGEDDAWALAPAGVIDRIVDELVGNAFSYAKTEIDVSVRIESGSVLLTVSDDGLGVSPDERELIFERFNRGAAAVHGGSGLGLALVRESARAGGGDAWIDVRAGGGFSVIVRWPLSSSSGQSV
jgi:signal transduction histidine kinase